MRLAYTFTDAVDANYNSKGISTLVVSIYYLIPQMLSAGALVESLLGIPHAWGGGQPRADSRPEKHKTGSLSIFEFLSPVTDKDTIVRTKWKAPGWSD